MQFLDEYGELESLEPEYWAAASGLSESGESGTGVMSIVPLSVMLFIILFKNISVSRFSPDDKKWASGAISEVVTMTAVAAG